MDPSPLSSAPGTPRRPERNGAGRDSGPAPGLKIAVLAIAGLSVSMMMTIVVPILPTLPAVFGVTTDEASWFVTITLLTSVVATPSLSRMADMYGRRRMLLVSLGAMVVGSIVAAASVSFLLLLLARCLQGLAVAAVPIAMSVMRDVLPGRRLPGAVALMSGSMGIGAAIGLPLSGVIATVFGWHAVFWLSAVLGAALALAVGLVIRVPGPPPGGRFDFLGAALLALGLGSLLLAITGLGRGGFTVLTALELGTSALSFSAAVRWAKRCSNPLIRLETARLPALALANGASILVGFVLYCNLLGSVRLLELSGPGSVGFALSPLAAGLAMLPTGLALVALAPVAAHITRRHGAAVTLLIGGAVSATAFVARTWLSASVWQVMLGAFLVACGTAFGQASLPVIVMSEVPVDETAAANGVNTVLRSVGTSTASATVAAILAGVLLPNGQQLPPSASAFDALFWLAGLSAALGAVLAGILMRVTHSSDAVASLDVDGASL